MARGGERPRVRDRRRARRALSCYSLDFAPRRRLADAHYPAKGTEKMHVISSMRVAMETTAPLFVAPSKKAPMTLQVN